MPPITSSEFDRLVRALSHDDFLAFIADLWAAQGWTPIIYKSTITIGRPSTIETYQLYPVHGPPDTSIDSTDTLQCADIFVANVETPRLRTKADRFDARYVGPGDLYKMVLYAIDRETGDQLFQRYFDRSIHRQQPRGTSTDTPPGEEVKDGDLESRVGPTTGQNAGTGLISDPQTDQSSAEHTQWLRYIILLSLGLFVVLGIGVIVIANGVGVVPESDDLSPDPDPAGFVEPTVTGNRYPVGIGPQRISNVAALARAHTDAMSGRSYTLAIGHRHARGLFVTNFRWIDSTQYLRVNTSQHFTYRVTGTLPPKTVGASPSRIAFVESANETPCRHQSNTGSSGQPPEDTTCHITSHYDPTNHFARISGEYLRRYLDTSHSEIQRIRTTPQYRYRIIATGTPARIGGETDHYRATAVITDGGIVLELRVEYTVLKAHRSQRIWFEFRYTRIGDTTTSP